MQDALDPITYERVKELCERGDELANRAVYEEAVSKYNEALELLPHPRSRWEAATWIFTALGDAYFLNKDFKQALDALTCATGCPGGVGNPFIHLRLGQAQYQLGNEVIATDELARAYMGGGENIFQGEDPVYFQLVKNALRAPPGGW